MSVQTASITPAEAVAAQAAKGQAAPVDGAVAIRPEYIPEKFWKDGKVDSEGLAKSYTELEKAKATPPPPVPQPAAVPVSVPGVEQVRIDAYSKEISEGGKLSEASYAELATKGYGKAVVDAYVRGLTADQAQAQAVDSALIADKEITAIKAGIGGDQGLANMIAWAKTGLTATELTEYNEAVKSTDVARVKMAVTGLHALYTKESGSQPDLIGGRPAGGDVGDVYASKEEMIVDMQNPKYEKDPAFRAAVGKKLSRSKII